MTPEQMEALADMIAARLMGTFAARLDMIEEVVFAESYIAPTDAPDIGPMDKEWTIGRAARAWGVPRRTVYDAVARGVITHTTNGKGERVLTTQQMVDRYGYPENQEPAITVAADGEANAEAVSFSKLKRGATVPRKRKDVF
jgi:N-acetyl-anhydromuramyl-L-alanine amidase AmpD